VALPGVTATALAATPDARYVLAASQDVRGVVAVDVAKNQVVSNAVVSWQSPPVAMAITPDGKTAFALGNHQLAELAIGANGGLSTVTSTSFGEASFMTDLSVTPDGRSLYLLDYSDLVRYDLPLAPQSPHLIQVNDRGLNRMVITPDGKKAYFTVTRGSCLTSTLQASCGPPGKIDELNLVNLANGQITNSIALTQPGKGTPDPIDLAIATSPSGSSALWVADQANSDVIEVPLPVPAGFTPTRVVSVGTPTALAATPDGSRIEVTTANGVVGVDTGTASVICDLRHCPLGNGPIAITPDQRPQASFTAAPGVAGKATSFDASSSSVAFGGISTYAWDFGDGATQATAGPAVPHAYARPGTYHVTLVETDGAGATVATSPPSTIFTGRTMTRQGGTPARVTHDVTIPSPPKPTSTAPSSTSPAVPSSPIPTTGLTPSAQSGTPAITLIPAVGPPGTVVAVSGSGFAANTSVALMWKPGIGTATAFTDGSGAFQAQMLILPKDQLGTRSLQAQGFGASADFLVVPISVEPAGASVQLLFRR
jgi:PKD repeat protein